MTNFLQKTIVLADRWFEREIENAEILMRDLGSTEEEIEAAIGPNGYTRLSLEKDRAEQIAEVARWLSGNDGTRH